ncbi:MAG: DMT family transporter [Oscillatoria sp. SIO1A7]|nr:DMT family transporter [Oscillatoria sp. SIO1A7]
MTIHKISGRWRLGLGLSIFATLLWGILPIALKAILIALDVYTIIWFRFSIAFGVLGAYLAFRNQLPARRKLQQWHTLILLLAATGFLGIHYLLFLQGIALTSPANAELFDQLGPVLFGLGGLVIFKERYTLTQWAGLSIFTLGFVLFFHEKLQTIVSTREIYLLGNIVLIAGAVTLALYALIQKKLLSQLTSTNIMVFIYGGCAILFAPFATPEKLLTLSPVEWAILIFCSFNTLLAFGSFAEALAHWQASRVSAVVASAPIVTVIFVSVLSSLAPTLVAAEKFTVLAIFGAVLVVAGSAAIALGEK